MGRPESPLRMKPLYLLFPPSLPCPVPRSSSSIMQTKNGCDGFAGGKSAQWLRNPLIWTVQSCLHPGLCTTQAQLESMPGSLSERNGLSGSLLRLRRKRRNSNVDLFGTEDPQTRETGKERS